MDMRALRRIETERLILRPTAPEDFEAWAALRRGSRGHAASRRRAAAVDRLARLHRHGRGLADAGLRDVLGDRKVLGRWLGRLGPWMPEGWPGTEVGWGLVREAWGKGYARRRRPTAAIDWAFAHLGWSEVIHTIAADNAAVQGARSAARFALPAHGSLAGADRVRRRDLGPDARAVAIATEHREQST